MCRSGLTRPDYLMLQVPEIHIESLERTAWTKGTPVSSFGKNVLYKVYDAGNIIGASDIVFNNFFVLMYNYYYILCVQVDFNTLKVYNNITFCSIFQIKDK